MPLSGSLPSIIPDDIEKECVCVCVFERRGRGREKQRERDRKEDSVRASECECEREGKCLQYAINHSSLDLPRLLDVKCKLYNAPLSALFF